jgi:hypothetical protein
MGLSSDIQNIVQSAMGSIDDLRKSFTFVQRVPGTYNPTTGSVTIAETQVTVRGVLARFQTHEINLYNIAQTAQKALIPKLEFGSIDPDALEDQCIVNGKRFKILKVMKDPAEALIILALIAVED